MMETIVKNVTGSDGARAEVATIVFNGREFTSLGSIMDLKNGRLVAYVREGHGHLRGSYFDLVTWEDHHIAVLHKTGESRGFQGSRITHFYAVIDGYRWHGKVGLDWKEVITMRRGKKVQ